MISEGIPRGSPYFFFFFFFFEGDEMIRVLLLSLLTFNASAQTGSSEITRIWQFKPGSGVDRTYEALSTIVTRVGTPHEGGWINPTSKTVSSRTVEVTTVAAAFRRKHVESGIAEDLLILPYAEWRKGTPPLQYCTTFPGVTEKGHWIYEVKMCRTDIEDCSAWVETLERFGRPYGGGLLDGRPTGWWLYAY
jgi:hypothetical protein